MSQLIRYALVSCLMVLVNSAFFWTTDVAVAAERGVIRGVVQSESGVEGGVWVIAETNELETGFRKIVVTDDSGRFVVPDLDLVQYRVWVRGYGLRDSEGTSARPGDELMLNVQVAGTPQAD